MQQTDAEKAAHESAVDAFLVKLGAFLKAPNHSDADWPTIPDEEFREGYELVGEMLDLKWARDCDSDSPIRFRMHERRRYEDVCDVLLQRGPRGDETPDAEQERLIYNIRSLTGALSSIQHSLNMTHFGLYELHSNALRHKGAVPVFVVEHLAANDHPSPTRFPSSLHLTKEAAETAEFDGYTRRRIYSARAVPGRNERPADNFAEFRKKLADVTGQVHNRIELMQSVGFNLEHH